MCTRVSGGAVLLEHVQRAQRDPGNAGDSRQAGRRGREAERRGDRPTFRLRGGVQPGDIDEMAEATAEDLDALRRAVLVHHGQVHSRRLDTFHLSVGSLFLPEGSHRGDETAEEQ